MRLLKKLKSDRFRYGFETIAIFILISINFSGFSQIREQEDSNTDQRLIAAAKEIMGAAGTCALITLDDEGVPRVRAMDPFAPDEDFTIWFGTNSRSRKVDQIKKDPRVSLYYLDKDASGYVIIHGRARLVNDPKDKEKRWKAEWEAFYPDKTEDYLLIEVTPIWMEVLSPPRGISANRETWQPPVVNF